MKQLLALFIISLSTALSFAQDKSLINHQLTTKEVFFKETTLKDALEIVLQQTDIPYAIVLPANNPELTKTFEQAKVNLTFKAGIPYDELIRNLFIVGGINVSRSGTSWIIKSNADAQVEDELWNQSYQITKDEAKALGIIDATDKFNQKAVTAWLDRDSGEDLLYSAKRNILIVRSYKNKRDTISSLLHLLRQGYKTPALFSIEVEEKTQ